MYSRTDLCGGCRATGIPTATQVPNGTIPNTTPAVGHKTAPPPIFGFGTLEGYGLRVALAGFFWYV